MTDCPYRLMLLPMCWVQVNVLVVQFCCIKNNNQWDDRKDGPITFLINPEQQRLCWKAKYWDSIVVKMEVLFSWEWTCEWWNRVWLGGPQYIFICTGKGWSLDLLPCSRVHVVAGLTIILFPLLPLHSIFLLNCITGFTIFTRSSLILSVLYVFLLFRADS